MINRSLARFHFLAGLPRSGVSVLVALLAQNPRFVARCDSPAAAVFTKMRAAFPEQGPERRNQAGFLSDGQRIALWRSALDAVYHDRPFGAVVFDANRDWVRRFDMLVQLYPLSRFIFCVRNPAHIANSILSDRDPALRGDTGALAREIGALTAPDGAIGQGIDDLRALLTGAHAERVLVLDYDRLADDPEEAMDVVYDFLREPVFGHDFNEIGGTGMPAGPVRRSARPAVLPTKTVLQLSGRAFWRNLRRTRATMLLGRAR